MNANWIALYLAIVKEVNVSKALSIMELSTRKKSCANSSKSKN
ncbi:hypothetical protein [Clostridium botulinum]|nr:hypothetical protein [Clostridium botulinum]